MESKKRKEREKNANGILLMGKKTERRREEYKREEEDKREEEVEGKEEGRGSKKSLGGGMYTIPVPTAAPLSGYKNGGFGYSVFILYS